MAMWLTKQRASPGNVFGSMDKFEGLGIFFDTYKNNRPGTVFPYVMAMNGDGKTPYDKDNDGKANEIAGCSVRPPSPFLSHANFNQSIILTHLSQARGIRNANIPTKARLTYFADSSLKLELQYKTESDWTTCFEIADFKAPPVAYLGFSAETGELSDNHDIISVKTQNLYKRNPSANAGKSTKAGSTDKKGKTGSSYSRPLPGQETKGSWTWFFFKFILFGLAVTGAYVGFTIYRAKQRDRF